LFIFLFFFQAEDGIRVRNVTGVQTCALPIFVVAITASVKALIDAVMATTMYAFGVTGTFGGGLLEFLSLNWIPLFNNHGGVYIRQIIIGIIFFFIYFFIFKFLIEKFDIKTQGRVDQEIKLDRK